MSFQSRGDSSIKSLLDILRNAQDGSSPAPAGPLISPTGYSNQTNTHTHTHTNTHTQTHPRTNAPHIPSKQQLDTLLASLAKTSGTSTPSSEPDSTSKVSRTLIEPFGPIAGNARLDRSTSRSGIEVGGDADGIQAEGSNSVDFSKDGRSVSPTRKGKERARARVMDVDVDDEPRDWAGRRARTSAEDDAAFDVMPFVKAIGIISDLLGRPEFVAEIRKMKADQDALERRMWAKGEKIRAEHERSIQAERDIAKIARRPISPSKKAQWSATLNLNMQDFHRQTLIPALDDLSARHRARLKELGVPGLGRGGGGAGAGVKKRTGHGDRNANGVGRTHGGRLAVAPGALEATSGVEEDDTQKQAEMQRVRRIMDLIQAGLEG